MEGWGFDLVLIGQESCWIKKRNFRSDQRDSPAKLLFDKEPKAQGGNRLALSFMASWEQIRSQCCLHMSHHTWDVRDGKFVLLFSCLSGPWQDFFIRQTDSRPWLISWIWHVRWKQLAVHVQHYGYFIPWKHYSLLVHICILKGPKRASMAAWAP